MNRRIVRAAFALVALAAALGAATASAANPCVVNKGAFVAEVTWYDPDSLFLKDFGSPKGSGLASRKLPKQADSIPLGQRSCRKAPGPMIAVIAIVGASPHDRIDVSGVGKVGDEPCAAICSYRLYEFVPKSAADGIPLTSGFKRVAEIRMADYDIELSGGVTDFKVRGAAYVEPPGSPNQCVVNNGAFIIDVRWFRDGDIHLNAKGRLATWGSWRYRHESVPVGQRSCNRSSEQMTAVVGVLGCIAFAPTLAPWKGKSTVTCFGAMIDPAVTEVLPDTLASCKKGCMQRVSRGDDPTALEPRIRGLEAPLPVVVVGRIPVGKSLEMSGTTSEVKYAVK